jgi:NAD(P)-dependent dehydrogenase (short-subunit alcohol dehydrogenase family)
VESAVSTFGRIDVALTAAGISHASYQSTADPTEALKFVKTEPEALQGAARFLDCSPESWQRVLEVNLTGTFLAVQAVAKHMVAEKVAGSIVTIGSISSKHPDGGPLSYAVSKSGVWMLTMHAARALGPLGIRVNSVAPGFTQTNMTAIMRSYPEATASITAGLPLRRMGEAAEIANAVLFLASDKASYVTGELLHVAGGYFTG